jgi:hypothetical protein
MYRYADQSPRKMTIPPRAKATPPFFPLFFALAIFGVKEKPKAKNFVGVESGR